jgi:hypothetical protein
MYSQFLSKTLGLRGAGDAVALVAKPTAWVIDTMTALGPKPIRTHLRTCGGCTGRQARWNKKIPFVNSLAKPPTLT